MIVKSPYLSRERQPAQRAVGLNCDARAHGAPGRDGDVEPQRRAVRELKEDLDSQDPRVNSAFLNANRGS